MDEEIEDLEQKYKKCAPGKIVESKLLGKSIEKREIDKVKIADESISSISPLIAKIVRCFLWYNLSPEQIASIKEIEMLRDHARYGKDMERNIINWLPLKDDRNPQSWHGVRLLIDNQLLLLDITFFGFLNWRVVLRSEIPIIVSDEDDKQIEVISLVNYFQNISEKSLFFTVKHVGSDEVKLYDLGKFRYIDKNNY